MFFPSYHAYGRADGAGMQDKVHANRDFRAGVRRLGAEDYTAMTNESHDPRSVAVCIPQINR